VIKEVQSIIKNSTTLTPQTLKKTPQIPQPVGSNPSVGETSGGGWDREMKNLKFSKISPPLQHGSSKIVSPRFSPRLINNMNLLGTSGLDETTNLNTSYISTSNNLRSSSSNLFRAFSHSPTPKGRLVSDNNNEVEEGKERILEESESEEERSIITPPLRTSNPIIYNSPFRKMIEKNKNNRNIPDFNNQEGGDIGLLSISPTPPGFVPSSGDGLNGRVFLNTSNDNIVDHCLRVNSDPNVDVVNSIPRSRLHSVEEIDEVLFRFDSS